MSFDFFKEFMFGGNYFFEGSFEVGFGGGIVVGFENVSDRLESVRILCSVLVKGRGNIF